MTIYFPLDQTESASHKKPDTLLATRVFKRLTQFIQTAVDAVGDDVTGQAFQANRRHNAVLIDGARGTGKSSVLVNLATVLGETDPSLLAKVHVLKPVDPTLLEDDDNLFLNVIVAAVLSDEAVRDAQERKPEQRQVFQRHLQRLGHSLESMQSQRGQLGLDKIRSFVGNHQLVEEVHHFFHAMLNLLGKKLLVLAIDDVDTSLDHAFENLEVVRRYLTTPFVLPILSGDLGLYHEVTWRGFLSRLLRETSYDRRGAFVRAEELASDYQRKVLPLQYRLAMPTAADYLKDPSILLGRAGDVSNLPLPSFHMWLEGLLNGSVNGLENSYLEVPIANLRALAQLVHRTRPLITSLIPALTTEAAGRRLAGLDIRRALVMPQVAINTLQRLRATQRLGTEGVKFHADFSRELQDVEPADLPGVAPLREIAKPWYAELREHFRTDPQGGAVYLVLQARADWLAVVAPEDAWRSVFDTPLFQPLRHDAKEFEQFERPADLREWSDRLKMRAPESWLSRLPISAILPYPVPEAGYAVPGSAGRYARDKQDGDGNLVLDLLLHRNFYSTSQRALQVCTGRIIELVVMSLLRDVTERDIGALLQRPPFYSYSAFAATKAIAIGEDDNADADDRQDDNETAADEHVAAIASLTEEIRVWRQRRHVSDLNVSPWLIYNVLNKVINQVWLFNKPLALGAQPRAVSGADAAWTGGDVAWIGRQTFYSLWAAFGSFEKGPLFGLPDVVAYVNIGTGAMFESSALNLTNIAPFYRASSTDAQTFGDAVRAVTAVLGDHPLRALIDRYAESPRTPEQPSNKARRRLDLGPPPSNVISTDAKAWLKERLEIKKFPANPVRAIERTLPTLLNNRTDARRFLSEFTKLFPHDARLAVILNRAVDSLFPVHPA